ncbi:carnitine/acylcarnitine carrier protein [Capsaspora owczarzaki ATCC 30864]|uniref:Carnitine/acylcarnitine carrier protein n=1 Tax=Capsaspora owczarzaki (strain ATCC 30864) TaxID=595528 RepID=A0A0D2WYG4_CAPO3|nr:carnitine/acylcarnitine carrier protein [Capsaspora owczarzaki ATCC 30864]
MAEAPTSFGLGEVGKDFIAGTFAGCAGILTGHPFDTIKVRLQTQTHTPGTQLRYSGTIHCFVKIVREEKIRGLYKGMASPMAGVALINAMLFGVYGNSVRLLEGSGSAEPARRPSIQTVFIAGAASGLVNSFASCPIELVKTRLQIQMDSAVATNSGSSSLPSATPPATTITTTAAAPTAASGTGPTTHALAGSAPKTTAGAMATSAVPHRALHSFSVFSSSSPSSVPLSSALASFKAATSSPAPSGTTSSTSVIWSAVRRRLPLSRSLSTSATTKATATITPSATGAAAATAAATAEPLYKGPWDCFVRTVRQDGIRGIYRGLVPTMLRETPSYGVYFAAYEMLCLRLAGPGRSPDDLSAPALMLAGGASGMAGWLSTYPTDVVKSRMQADSMTNPQYRGFVDCVVKSYRAEGLGVFFRGFNATMVRAFPTNASTFVVYTMCMRLLGGVDTSQDHSHTRHME